MRYLNLHTTPSYLGTRTMGFPQGSNTFSTVQLLQGEVKEAVYPSNPKSLSKRYVEYRVDVQYRDGSGPATTTTFPHCQIMNFFGGNADKFHYTLRADPSEPNGEDILGTGSKVLILCLNGETSRAYIVGGIREDEVIDALDDGHNLRWEFNGTEVTINKAGEFKVQVKGPTNADGSLNEEQGKAESFPTTLEITQNGNLRASTKDDKQSLELNHETSTVNVKADSIVTVKSAGLHVGDATNQMMLASTYREHQQLLHNTIMPMLTALSGLLATAGAGMASASTSHIVPVVGPIIGAPMLASGAAALTAAAPLVTSIMAAIQAFEATSALYLSQKNKND